MKHTKKHTSKRHSAKPVVIGLIYADWCGHCQALKPEWDMFKKNLNMDKKLANKCDIFDVEDSDTLKDIKIKNISKKVKGGEVRVDGFPTLFKIVGGNIEYYSGERNSSALLEWAKSSIQKGGKTRKHRKTNKKQ
jgi:thiol-disulfide isomerase/thioredoxin